MPEPLAKKGGFITRYGMAKALLGTTDAVKGHRAIVEEAVSTRLFSDPANLRLEDVLTRAEAVVMAARKQQLAPLDAGLVRRTFKDLPISHWASGAVYGAMVAGVVQGFSDETFQPNGQMQADWAYGVIAKAKSPPGKPTDWDPRQEWGARSVLAGAAKVSGGSQAHSLDPSAHGGVRDAGGDKASRVGAANRIVDQLDASNSWRYQPTPTKTFCNVFGHDYAFLMGAFVPRVWWKDWAIKKFETEGAWPDPVPGVSVHEMTANALHDWFGTWGHRYGWSALGEPGGSSLTIAQDMANDGRVAVITGAKSPGYSGHITAIVPETGDHKAVRDDEGHVINPLQSQSGRLPRTRATDSWFANARNYWGGRGVWVHG